MQRRCPIKEAAIPGRDAAKVRVLRLQALFNVPDVVWLDDYSEYRDFPMRPNLLRRSAKPLIILGVLTYLGGMFFLGDDRLFGIEQWKLAMQVGMLLGALGVFNLVVGHLVHLLTARGRAHRWVQAANGAERNARQTLLDKHGPLKLVRQMERGSSRSSNPNLATGLAAGVAAGGAAWAMSDDEPFMPYNTNGLPMTNAGVDVAGNPPGATSWDGMSSGADSFGSGGFGTDD